MDHKYQPLYSEVPVAATSSKRRVSFLTLWSVVLVLLSVGSLVPQEWRNRMPWHRASSETSVEISKGKVPQVTRQYNLTVGAKWLSLDGGRWRPMFVCNGESPCTTMTAREGDLIELHVTNDLPAQMSIHWSGMSHRRLGFWNDGTGGLNQYPILPRGNWTSKFDTTGHWGLNWYADHSGAGVADGVYGMIWTAPSPDRPRPYHLITKSKTDLKLIQEAEDEIDHVALWNSDFRTADWKIQKMKAKGTGLHCYKSILVNGIGRVHCKHPKYNTIDGQELDAAGCIQAEGIPGDACTPSKHDYQIIQTKGRPYIMLNFINIGFEHALKLSIDDHKFWVVATDAGFVRPQEVDTVYITNGAKVTLLIKTDKIAADYAIRLASASRMQNLEGFAILRYPAKRYPLLGRPMELPAVSPETKICLNADSSVPEGCHELDHNSVRPYPAVIFPTESEKTLLWTAGSKQSEFEEHVTEYFVNEKPWQLYRAAMEPVYFTKDAENSPKPVQAGLPYGMVIDLIVQNTINDTIPMYKHGDPTFRLGSQAYEKFEWSSIDEAVKKGARVNVDYPPLGVVHDLPPLGWLAIRWKVNLEGATMFHAVKLRYFALGMAAPLLEGFEKSVRDEIPYFAKHQPHVEFEPANTGVFG